MLRRLAANGLGGRMIGLGCPQGLAFMLANTVYRTRQGAGIREEVLEHALPGIGRREMTALVKNWVEGPLTLDQVLDRAFGENKAELLEFANEFEQVAQFMSQRRSY